MDVLKRIEELKEERGWSNYKLSRESGINASTLSAMFKKNNFPTLPTIEALCKGFGISVSAFFIESKEQHYILTEEQKDVLRLFSALSKTQKEKVCIYMQGLLDK